MSTTDKLAGAIVKKPAAAAPAAERAPGNPIVSMLLSPQFKAQMQTALPKTLTADRMARIVLTEFRKTPALMRCDQQSLFGAVLQCASLGLEPGSALGHCYLVPYGKTCTLIVGYRGMIDLARRSGQIVSLSAYCVHQADEFHYELGLHPDIRHVPSPDAERGPVTFIYAVAILKDGGCQFEVMSRAEVEAIRKRSKSGGSGPWATDWEAMAKKTVIRRLFKYLPVSIEATRAVEADEKSERGEAVTEQDWINAEFVDKGTKVAPVIADVPDEVTQPASATAEKNPAPAKSPDDAWVADMDDAQKAPR